MKFEIIALGTANKNKVREIRSLFSDIEIIEPPKGFDPEETGATFEQNAYIKAFEAAKLLGIPALADDSGLEVDALGGRPGVYSARYAQTDELRIEKLLDELKETPKEQRTARFTCAMKLVSPDGETLHTSIGHCEGLIISEKLGANGFGYDPVFFIPEYGKTMAEMTMDEKNQVSHRSKALKDMIEFLQNT